MRVPKEMHVRLRAHNVRGCGDFLQVLRETRAHRGVCIISPCSTAPPPKDLANKADKLTPKLLCMELMSMEAQTALAVSKYRRHLDEKQRERSDDCRRLSKAWIPRNLASQSDVLGCCLKTLY